MWLSFFDFAQSQTHFSQAFTDPNACQFSLLSSRLPAAQFFNDNTVF